MENPTATQDLKNKYLQAYDYDKRTVTNSQNATNSNLHFRVRSSIAKRNSVNDTFVGTRSRECHVYAVLLFKFVAFFSDLFTLTSNFFLMTVQLIV